VVRFVAVACSVVVVSPSAAVGSRPSYPAVVPLHWHAPTAWLRDAVCIHEHEGAWNANTGNGQYGGMQFSLSTWQAVGGVTRPDLATKREQLYRAWLWWKRRGRWGGRGGWPSTAIVCGLY
jgi:resuscitation-promoting factor RpfB